MIENTEKISLSVVIPVYNGAATISLLCERIETVLSDACATFEILLINDHSADQSWQIIQALSKENAKIQGVNLMRNFGQHNAVLCGIRKARFDTIVTMDDDLQHPPEEIPALIMEYQKGFDVVYAVPKKLPHSWWRNSASKLTKRILGRIINIPLNEIGAFRIFRTELREAFKNYQSPDVYIDPLLSWGTANFGRVLVCEEARSAGKSNYTFQKLVRAGLLILTGYSTFPLKLASSLGFVFMVFGFGILIYVTILALSVGSVPGFPFLASIIALFSGVQLFTLGIFGEYLSRIYERASDRPPYVIKEETE